MGNWMLKFCGGIWLKAKTLKLLKDHYDYEPAVPGIQNAMFSGCVKRVLAVKGSEHDAAALFMISQLGIMGNPQNLDEKGQAFVRRIRDMVWVDWDRLVIQDDLSEMMGLLDEV